MPRSSHAHSGSPDDVGTFDRPPYVEDALTLFREALDLARTNGEMYWVPEFLRLAAEALLARPMPDASRAEGNLNGALEIARRQEAKFWELRAALALARLWSSQGRWTEAATLVAPILGWFTEGFDAPDLKEAKSMLQGSAPETPPRTAPGSSHAVGHNKRGPAN